MPITFCQIACLVRARKVRITAETLGYLVLAAAEQATDARRWEPAVLTLESSGSVTANDVDGGLAPSELIPRMLGGMLAGCTTENPGLERCARVAPASLERLREELRAALVPINRGAARRALIRLHKDALQCGDALPTGPMQPSWLGDAPVRHQPVEAPAGQSQGLPHAHSTPILGSQVASVAQPEDDRTPLQLPPYVLDRDADLPPSPYLAEHVPLRSDVFELLDADTARAV